MEERDRSNNEGKKRIGKREGGEVGTAAVLRNVVSTLTKRERGRSGMKEKKSSFRLRRLRRRFLHLPLPMMTLNTLPSSLSNTHEFKPFSCRDGAAVADLVSGKRSGRGKEEEERGDGTDLNLVTDDALL
jgi:hypothetical protein